MNEIFEDDYVDFSKNAKDSSEKVNIKIETYQQCNICGSIDIDKQSGAMGVHTCNNCGSGASISWKEREILIINESS